MGRVQKLETKKVLPDGPALEFYSRERGGGILSLHSSSSRASKEALSSARDSGHTCVLKKQLPRSTRISIYAVGKGSLKFSGKG